MDRRSNKHGPRIDDELVHGTESIVDGAPVEAHAVLARRLEPSVFPAERDELLASAEQEHAPDWVLDALRSLPDAAYPTTESVWRAMSEV